MENKKYTMHSADERRSVLELHGKGLGSKRIARLTGIDPSLIRRWLRDYRERGDDALVPYSRRDASAAGKPRTANAKENEERFRTAYPACATSLEPLASIARRFGLPYNRFRYHVARYHPEFVKKREILSQGTVGEDMTKNIKP